MSAITWDTTPSFELRRDAARPEGGSAAAGLRLTPRGRLVVLVLALVLALAAGLSAQSATADPPRDALPVVTHTVVAGETLWQIAGSVAAPGQDVRDVVGELVELNGLAGAGLQAGQQILVPSH